MADNIAGLGRFGGRPSDVGMQYVEGIRQAGEKLSRAGAGYTAARMEIKRREAEARAKIGTADPDKLGTTVTSILGADALEMKQNIGGEGQKAYDFSNVNDIARFAKDVEQLNANIAEAEQSHASTVGSPDDGPDANTYYGLISRTKLSQASGGATEGYVYEDLAGEGDFYDANSSDYQAAFKADSLMNASKVEKTPAGKYLVTLPDGEEKEFGTLGEVLEAQQVSVLPSYERMPEKSGRDIVIENKWGPNLYETADQAESAYVQWVLQNPKAAERRLKTRSDAKTVINTPAKSKEAQDVLEKYGITEEFTQAQFEMLQEMMQEWRDETNAPKAEKEKKEKSSGDKKTEELIGRIGDIAYTKNEGMPDESSIGGTGVTLGGQVLRSGEMKGAKMQQLIYNPASETFTVVVTDPNGVEADFELDPTPQSFTRTIVMGALGMNNQNMNQLLKEIRRRGQ